MAKKGSDVEDWAKELGLCLENEAETEAANFGRKEGLLSLMELGYKLKGLIKLSSQEIMHLEFQYFDIVDLILEKFDSEKEYVLFGLTHGYITEDLETIIREGLGLMNETKLNSILDEYNALVSVESADVEVMGDDALSVVGIDDIDVCV